MEEQRSIEWYKSRLGKITSSEIYLLIRDRKIPMSDEELAEYKKANPKSRVTSKTVPFSEATFTWLNRKVMENCMPLWSEDTASINAIEEYIDIHNVYNRAVRWGVDMEPVARDRYSQVMGLEVEETGFIPSTDYPNLYGGSPDGIVVGEAGCIEIKCPFTLEKHLQHFLYKDTDDLRINDEQYYWQCVSNMIVTETDFCDFISYCPYLSPNKQLKVLRVWRNKDHVKLLRERVALAVKYIEQELRDLNNVEPIIK